MTSIIFVRKKDGHLARFRTKQLFSSLKNAAGHAGYNDMKTLESILEEILKRLHALRLTTVPVARIREKVLAVLEERRLESLRDAYEFTFLRAKPIHISTVLKRNGAPQDFHPHNIFKGIVKALRETGRGTAQDAENLTKEILHRLETRFRASVAIPTTTIRQITEEVLREYNEKAFDAYRFHRYR